MDDSIPPKTINIITQNTSCTEHTFLKRPYNRNKYDISVDPMNNGSH